MGPQKADPTAAKSVSARLCADPSGDGSRTVCWVRASNLSRLKSESCDFDMILVVVGREAVREHVSQETV